MAFKVYVPAQESTVWDNYWNRLSIESNLKNCESDGLLPILEKYLPRDGKILEAGCGLGKWVIFLKRLGYNVQGIDSYQKAVAALKQFDNTLEVSVDNVESLSFKDDSCDAYLSFGVIEHFEKGPEKVLLEAHRILKEDGIIVVEVPCDNPLRRFLRLKNRIAKIIKTPARIIVEGLKLRTRREKPDLRFYEYRYTEKELISYLQKAGFTILGSYPKDDLSPDRSIGLWLDFLKLRKINAPDFYLNNLGVLIKKTLGYCPKFWSACIVVVAKKNQEN